MRRMGIVGWFVLLIVISSPAQETQIRQLYRNILARSSGQGVPKDDEIFSKVNEITVGALSEAEIDAILPLAWQCIQSPDPEIRQNGLAFFISVVIRPDSSKLLEPYVDDLGKLLNGAESVSPRHTILYVLGSLKPNLTAKAIT
jgi:hypothetical protein